MIINCAFNRQYRVGYLRNGFIAHDFENPSSNIIGALGGLSRGGGGGGGGGNENRIQEDKIRLSP